MKKLDIDAILSRIAKIEGIKFSDTELGEVLGKKRSTVSSWRLRGSIPFADIIEYCEKKRVSLDGVFFDAPLDFNVDAVEAIMDALDGHDLPPKKRRKIIAMVAAKWPMSTQEIKLLIELAI
jgi:hypothetical protein